MKKNLPCRDCGASARQFAGCNKHLRQRHGQSAAAESAIHRAIFRDGRSERPVVEKRSSAGLQDDSLIVPKESNRVPLPLPV